LEYLLPVWQLEFKENILSKRIEIYRAGNLENTELELIATELINNALTYNLQLRMHDTVRSIAYIAHTHRYNPWLQFLQDCYSDWDGTMRFDDFFEAFILDENYCYDAKFIKTLLKKWMIAAVRIANNNGTIIPQGILVILGPQGIGKTRFVNWLMPISDMVLLGSFLDPTNKDSLMTNTSRAIVELGELGESMKKRNALKAFFTRAFDTYRRVFGLHDNQYPRMTSYIGTTNEPFLTDVTGSRRFWTLPVVNINYCILNKINVNHLWGEIYHYAFNEKISYFLDDDERDKLNRFNVQFMKKSSDEQAILDGFDWISDISTWVEYTASDVCNLLHLTGNRQAQVGIILNHMVAGGVINEPVHKHNTGKHYYLLPPFDYAKK
jgi:predicted P-loop ATPase